MKQEFIISAVGLNVSGIVAKVAKAVYRSGGNFEDSSMTLLGSHFALMVLVTAADETIAGKLIDACARLERDKDLDINLFPIEKSRGHGADASVPNYEIRVKGVDQMGIVYRTSQLLASLDINIVELETKIVEGKNGTPIFSMRTAVVVPENVDGETLRKDLKLLAEDNRETISLISI
jgi:glycine cleavage system transcriptional repressor